MLAKRGLEGTSAAGRRARGSHAPKRRTEPRFVALAPSSAPCRDACCRPGPPSGEPCGGGEAPGGRGSPDQAGSSPASRGHAGLRAHGGTGFAPHSAGLRPGRSAWEAMGALSVLSTPHAHGVLEADLAPGFARIDPPA